MVLMMGLKYYFLPREQLAFPFELYIYTRAITENKKAQETKSVRAKTTESRIWQRYLYSRAINAAIKASASRQKARA
jgi:hypothetical protein